MSADEMEAMVISDDDDEDEDKTMEENAASEKVTEEYETSKTIERTSEDNGAQLFYDPVVCQRCSQPYHALAFADVPAMGEAFACRRCALGLPLTPMAPFACNYCEFACASVKGVMPHYRLKHAPRKSYKCKRCDFTASAPILLTGHSASMHPKRFPCEHCRRRFDTEGSLRRHEAKKHAHLRPTPIVVADLAGETTVDPYVCTICPNKCVALASTYEN